MNHILISVNEFIEILKVEHEKLISAINQTNSKSPQSSELRELNSPKVIAKYFGVSKPCLYDWDEKNILKPIKIGGRVYYKREDVELLMNKKKG